jgi:hypothetical protein
MKTSRMLVGALAIGLLAAAYGSAAPGDKLKEASASTTIAPEDIGTATATCKRGTKAISGGFAGEEFAFPGIHAVVPYEARRQGARKWTTGAFNLYGSSNPAELTAFAYCRDEKVKRKSAEAALEGEAGPGTADTETVTVKCPRGTKALSGGFANPGFGYHLDEGPGIFPYVSKMAGRRGWTVSAANVGNRPGTFEAWAYCRKGEALKRSRQTYPQAGGATTTFGVKCRNNRDLRVVSGGFAYADAPAGQSSDGPFVFQSFRDNKRNWTVAGYNHRLEPTTLRAYAYCEKR